MSKYFFVLGNNPELSQAEIKAVWPDLAVDFFDRQFLVAKGKLEPVAAMERLGGTIKIGRLLGEQVDLKQLADLIVARKKSGRAVFGLSFYGRPVDRKLGFQLKKILKERGINSRLVTSREPALSSVIVAKEKCLDVMLAPGYVAVTEAVQDFATYGRRDFGRPKSDARSGMLPPKLAKMMINLSLAQSDQVLLDPFCGSGTILAEAAALGLRNLIGADISPKAVEDTQENLAWLKEQWPEKDFQAKVFLSAVEKLSATLALASVDAIVTEPYLGRPLSGRESSAEIAKIMAELSQLYRAAFIQFVQILKSGGRVVMVCPEWHLAERINRLKVEEFAGPAWRRLDDGELLYKREGQKVWRRILILESK